MIFRSPVSVARGLCCAVMIAASMLESALAMTPAVPQAKLVISVGSTGGEPLAAVSETKRVMATRLREVGLFFAIRADGGRIFVTVHKEAEPFVERLLTAPGVITLRIYTGGEGYSLTSRRPIAHASLGKDEMGQPEIALRISDPTAFHRFTSRHINQRLGIYLDGNEIAAPEITAPLSDSVQITGNASAVMSSMFVSIVNSGPLPVPVKVLVANRSVSLRVPPDRRAS